MERAVGEIRSGEGKVRLRASKLDKWDELEVPGFGRAMHTQA